MLVILAVIWTSTCIVRSGNTTRELVSTGDDMELRSEQRTLYTLNRQEEDLNTPSANTFCPVGSTIITLIVSRRRQRRTPQHRNARTADTLRTSHISQDPTSASEACSTSSENVGTTSRITRGRHTISDDGCRPSSTGKKGLSAK